DVTSSIDSDNLENPPPLIPVLCEKMAVSGRKLPPSIMKYLGRDSNVPSLLPDRDLAHAVEALECVDPSWYPNTPQEWKDFNLASGIAKVFSQIHRKDFKACMDDIRLMAMKGQPRWGSIKAGLYALGGSGRVQDVGDWHQQVLLLCLEAGLGALVAEQGLDFDNVARHDLLAAAKAHAIAGMTIQAQIMASNRYHEAERLAAYRLRLAGIVLKKSIDVTQPSWLPLAKPMLHRHSSEEQTFAFCVTDKEGLVTLADVQGHCVHGYDTSCVAGRSHIVALVNYDVLKKLGEIPVSPPPTPEEIEAAEQAIPPKSNETYAAQQHVALMKWQAVHYEKVRVYPDMWREYLVATQTRRKHNKDELPDMTSSLLRLALDAAKYHHIKSLWHGISTVELQDDNAGRITQRQHQGYPMRRKANSAERDAVRAFMETSEKQIDLPSIQYARMSVMQAFPDRYQKGQEHAQGVAFEWSEAEQRNQIFQAARSLLVSDADRNASSPLTWGKNRRLDRVLKDFLGKRKNEAWER
ncbi:MAG: hypothetical protein WAZ18_03175, partial [Alphaproteobacteria bacterium]